MNYAAAQFGLNIAILIINLGLGFYTYRSNKEKVTNTRFRELEDRMQKVETASVTAPGEKTLKDRLTEVETKVKSMPVCGNHDRMEKNDEKLFGRLDQLHGDICKLVGGVDALKNSMDLVNQHLLNGGK